jgi:uncharacterized protein
MQTSHGELLTTGRMDASAHILVAHGAGSPMTSPFLETLSGLMSDRGLCVHRFEFAYMRDRHISGKRRPPPKAEILCPEFDATVAKLAALLPPARTLLIGGKSLGGRVASLSAARLVDDRKAAGLVCFGYPFHPPKDPSKLRTGHLLSMTAPTLILQGERDPFGNRDDVMALGLPASIELIWLADGDHDFGPRGANPATRRGNLEAAAEAVAQFSMRLASPTTAASTDAHTR